MYSFITNIVPYSNVITTDNNIRNALGPQIYIRSVSLTYNDGTAGLSLLLFLHSFTMFSDWRNTLLVRPAPLTFKTVLKTAHSLFDSLSVKFLFRNPNPHPFYTGKIKSYPRLIHS